MRNVKVAIWGFGAMGRGVGAMLLKKKGVEITGVINRRSNLGKEIHELLGVERKDHPAVTITNNVEEVIFHKSCDVVVICTDSFTKDSYDKIKLALENKLNVVSTAEEFAFPQAQNPELTASLDKIARENGVTALGTGINPGFILDYLIVALTGTCEEVTSIAAQRVNDLSPFGPAVMHEQGVGITPETYRERMAANDLAGHVGFPESIAMVAEALGWKLEKVEQTKDPIISNTHREGPYATVEPGNLAGIRQQGYGYVNGEVKIHMDHPQQCLPHIEGTNTGDYIQIKGTPNISMAITPEIPGGIGTISMSVNMIPHVINAAPGVVTMLDLPVPRAIMGDFRHMIKKLD
ncbi:MAG: 2,4-diaminopentanoate dehydrogenase [Defluviitaleaceae bacterium]|nr:2,4-diaminopentanoate dehydrogenase [Defluviitaleaceae bacterium]MCL2837027.1 2,4-diaminopentanoate dehydrogenase [Defluviitaleaceae bacterium]